MKKIDFNQKNFGCLRSDIGWCSINCPICNQYHPLSFIPVLKEGMKEYLTKCERCNTLVIVDMGSIEQNDKLISYFRKQEERIINQPSPKCRKLSNGKKEVEILITEGHTFSPSNHDGKEYTSVNYNCSTYGGASPCITRKEISDAIKHAKETIVSEGDIHILRDCRKKATLQNWL